MSIIIIIKAFIFTLLFTLSFQAHSPAPQLGSDDSLSPSLSPPAPSPESDLTPPHSSPPADTPSPENVKSEESKEDGSGGKKARIVVGVMAALCVVWLGHLCNNHRINQPNPQGNMAHNHHINQPNPRYVFVKGEFVNGFQYSLILDDHTFPQNVQFLPTPEALQELTNIIILGNINQYQCFYGDVNAETKRVVMWNPMWNPHGEDVQFVSIDIPISNPEYRPRVGFGVCPRTGDVKLVKFNIDYISREPEVELFTINTMLGTYVSRIVPVRSRIWRDLECAKFCEKGLIYFRAYDNIYLPAGFRSNFFVSFNLVTERFGQVPLPWSLPSTGNFIQSVKVNGSLGLLKYQDDGSCDVWTKREGANGSLFWQICNFYGVYETFAKIRTIRVEGQRLYGNVLGFRNNGDVIIELDVNNEESRIVVYEQGQIRDVEIHGVPRRFSVRQL